MKKLILLIFLFIIACGKPSENLSILERSNCELPCWNGIVPGKTTEKEALEILGALSDVNQGKTQITDQPWNIYDNQVHFSFRQGWAWSQRPKLRGEIYIIDDTVAELVLCGKINTTIKEIVDLTGEPEHIISGNEMAGGRTVNLINTERGIAYFFTTELNNLKIAQNTSIDCIDIFDPALYEKLLDAGFFSSGYYNAQETRRAWYLWDGYGDLDEKYPPRQP